MKKNKTSEKENNKIMNKAVLEYDLYTINEHKELRNISLALSIKHHNKFLMKDIIENLFEYLNLTKYY